jgi:hypothetical protein
MRVPVVVAGAAAGAAATGAAVLCGRIAWASRVRELYR